MHQLSAEFRMNERRINRLLEREGTTYQKIVQEALSTLAERLLVDTDMPIGKISAVLNYADASVFTRSFRKWHGCSPSEWRSSHTRRGKETTSIT